MELRHLRYFVAVAEGLSFRGAAQRLNVAQPALSVSVQKLEAEIGTPLFTRKSRDIQLTDAGVVFLERARRLLAEAGQSIAMARAAADGEIGHLSIGYLVPAGFRVFPQILPAFRRQWPSVQLTFHDLKISQQLEGLRRGDLDVAFVWLPIPKDDFDVQPLTNEPLVAVLPADHKLAALKRVRFKDLSGEPMVLVARDLDAQTFELFQRSFDQAGAQMNVAYELESSLSMINFVAMGLGCSVLPDYWRMIPRDGVVYRPLVGPVISKSMAIVKKKGREGLTQAFYRFTLDTLPLVSGPAWTGRAESAA